jgi:hypothetical protein
LIVLEFLWRIFKAITCFINRLPFLDIRILSAEAVDEVGLKQTKQIYLDWNNKKMKILP